MLAIRRKSRPLLLETSEKVSIFQRWVSESNTPILSTLLDCKSASPAQTMILFRTT